MQILVIYIKIRYELSCFVSEKPDLFLGATAMNMQEIIKFFPRRTLLNMSHRKCKLGEINDRNI